MAEPLDDLVVFAVDERHTKKKKSNFTKIKDLHIIKAVREEGTKSKKTISELPSFVPHSGLKLDLVVVFFVLD